MSFSNPTFPRLTPWVGRLIAVTAVVQLLLETVFTSPDVRYLLIMHPVGFTAQPWGALPIQLATVVAAARSYAAGRLRTPPTARVRTRSGQWLVVHASPLDSPTGATGQVVNVATV